MLCTLLYGRHLLWLILFEKKLMARWASATNTVNVLMAGVQSDTYCSSHQNRLGSK